MCTFRKTQDEFIILNSYTFAALDVSTSGRRNYAEAMQTDGFSFKLILYFNSSVLFFGIIMDHVGGWHGCSIYKFKFELIDLSNFQI